MTRKKLSPREVRLGIATAINIYNGAMVFAARELSLELEEIQQDHGVTVCKGFHQRSIADTHEECEVRVVYIRYEINSVSIVEED